MWMLLIQIKRIFDVCYLSTPKTRLYARICVSQRASSFSFPFIFPWYSNCGQPSDSICHACDSVLPAYMLIISIKWNTTHLITLTNIITLASSSFFLSLITLVSYRKENAGELTCKTPEPKKWEGETEITASKDELNCELKQWFYFWLP